MISLAANKFNYRLPLRNGFGNLRHGIQELTDQCAIVDVTDTHPKHGRPLTLCRAEKREIAILGDKNGRPRSGFVPDRPICRIGQPEFDDMKCFVSCTTHGFRQCRRKLGIDQKQQSYLAAMIGWST